jgi:hypothetical protein
LSSDEYGLPDPFGDFPSATNNVRLTRGGAAAATRRRHGLEVEDGGLLKDLVVIFVFLGVLLSMDFVSQEHGVPRDGPKDSNAGG